MYTNQKTQAKNIMISKKGGPRIGAGRPKGRNAYGEATQPVRIPLTLLDPIDKLLQDFSQLRNSKYIDALAPLTVGKRLRMPLYSSNVPAGFASPADDFVEDYLDLNDLLVKREEATFFVRVSGRSMIDAGIQPNDILIVDRSLEAQHGKIVIAVLNGEVTVKRLYNRAGKVILKAENPSYKDIVVEGELHIWGVVTSVIHQV